MIPAAELAAMQAVVESTLTQTVTRRRYTTTTDTYGNPVRNTSSTTTYPGRLVHRSADELNTDRDTQVSDWSIILPHDADVTGRDVLEVDGDTFEVVGEPFIFATGFDTHMRVEVNRVG